MPESAAPDEPLPPDTVLARPVVTYVVAPPAPAAPLELPTLSRASAAAGTGLVVLALAVTLLFSVAGGLGLDLVLRVLHRDAPSPMLLHTVIIVDKWISAALVLLFTVFLLRYYHLRPAAFGVRRDQLSTQAAWGLATLFGVYAAFAVSLAAVVVLLLLNPRLQEDLTNRAEFLGLLPVNSVLGAIALLIPVAIHEELLFRGLLIPFLRRLGLGWTWAIVASAAFFAVLHIGQGWLAIPQVFFIGIALGAFFVLSRSLLAVMIAHFCFDFAQLQLIRVLQPWMEEFSRHAAAAGAG